MKSLTLVFSTALCLAAFPAFAGGADGPAKSVTLAQADVTIGPDGVSIGERDHDRDRVRHHERDRFDRDHDRFDRDHDRRRVRLGDRDGDRGCRTVTVESRGETRTTRRCD
jgi:hypothetical protein